METPDTYQALFWGYNVIWALLVIYIASLGRRLKKLEDTK